jgi:hypothetical protein
MSEIFVAFVGGVFRIKYVAAVVVMLTPKIADYP